MELDLPCVLCLKAGKGGCGVLHEFACKGRRDVPIVGALVCGHHILLTGTDPGGYVRRGPRNVPHVNVSLVWGCGSVETRHEVIHLRDVVAAIEAERRFIHDRYAGGYRAVHGGFAALYN